MTGKVLRHVASSGATGCKVEGGGQAETDTRQGNHHDLAAALQQKTEFSLAEKRKLLLDVELSYDSYIKVGDKYFQPAAEEDQDGAGEGAEQGDLTRSPCCAGKCSIS